MKKLNEVIAKIEFVIGSSLLIITVLLVFGSAMIRFVPNASVAWNVDLAQLMFVWISMIGADLALKKRSHMGVAIVTTFFPLIIQKILAVFSYIICMAFCGFIFYYGLQVARENWLRSYQTLHFDWGFLKFTVSYAWAYAAICIFAIFMILTLIEQLFDQIKDWNAPELNRYISPVVVDPEAEDFDTFEQDLKEDASPTISVKEATT
ncbi:MAG: TRAP transporter small permease [Bifidobacteriaceae bacterium]|jgi:TRAP-type C4-dicarboxylate transport system permease small subunit|nr:TRAP transporter small permease [Bifidobacteriaceae bacterium]